jgi:hypothetical protein
VNNLVAGPVWADTPGGVLIMGLRRGAAAEQLAVHRRNGNRDSRLIGRETSCFEAS